LLPDRSAEVLHWRAGLSARFGLKGPRFVLVILVPAQEFEPRTLGLKELARVSVWSELGLPARSDQKLICI
jgi:hypothetical protein